MIVALPIEYKYEIMKLTSTWLEEDKDYTVKHTQLLPGQLTLKMIMGYFLGIL